MVKFLCYRLAGSIPASQQRDPLRSTRVLAQVCPVDGGSPRRILVQTPCHPFQRQGMWACGGAWG